MEIVRFSHEHKLNFVEVGKDAEAVRCYGCGHFFHGPAFTCNKCRMFFLHKSCAELPRQINEHVFNQQHPRILFSVEVFVCDGCGEFCSGLVYRCGICMFSLDIKCATVSRELAISKGRRGLEIKTMINHFSHNHQLTRCIFVVPDDKPLPCMTCRQNVHGKTIYACLSCTFFVDESCVNDMPEQIQSMFHPEHPLFAQPLGRGTKVLCIDCGDFVYGVSFNCSHCKFNLHLSCAKYQTRAIKLDCHAHPLLLLGKSNIGENFKGDLLLLRKRSNISENLKRHLDCKGCGEYCKEAFLCCKWCNFHIRLECVPLPLKVKHICHCALA